MKARCCQIVLLVLLCLPPRRTAVSADQREDAAGGSETTPPQTLLLRNGELLHGQVQRNGAQLILRTDTGTTIRFWREDVAMIGDSDRDAYHHQLARTDPRDPAAQLKLAEWCLSVPLLELAARHLEIASGLSPQHGHLPHLRQRLSHLRQASEQLQGDRKTVGSAPRAAPPTPGIEAEALAEFTTHVQPILLNRCGAATCHGRATPTDFALEQASWSRKPSRETTLRNVQAVLEQVDLVQPDQSPVLTVPSSPHGGLETAVYAPRESAQLQTLAAWVSQVTKPHASSPQTGRADAPSASSSARNLDPPGPLKAAPRPTSSSPPEQAAAIRRRAQPTLDPFDPAIFNRETQQVRPADDEP